MEGKKAITNERRFYPLLVSGSGLDLQQDAESNQVWSQLSKIPENNKKILLSTSIIENLESAERIFGWEPYCSARLAYFVRELFFQNISQSEFYKAAEALLNPQYQSRYNEILTYINNVILTSQPDPEEEEVKEESRAEVEESGFLKQYTLLDALSRYPNVSNQFITSENIKLKSQAALVRPTLSNWLKNYRDELGIGKHDAVARAKFLFESLNTKKLTSDERERLHALVRSLEDNELLDINTKSQELIFRNEEKESVAQEQGVVSQVPALDTFERFQNFTSSSGVIPAPSSKAMPAVPASFPPAPPREELQKVGTHTFLKEESGNASKDLQGRAEPRSGQMGTLRFSAGHILPAERYDLGKDTSASVDPRIEHFRPQEVAIPKEGTFSLPPRFQPAPQAVSAPQPPTAPTSVSAPPTPASLPVTSPVTPPLSVSIQRPENIAPKEQPTVVHKVAQRTSMFRIKPNKD